MPGDELSREREKAFQILREYEAIRTLIWGMTIADREGLEKTRQMISNMSRAELRGFTKYHYDEIVEMRHEYGARVPNAEFVRQFDEARSRPNRILYLSKQVLKELFGRYDKVIRDFHKLPEHVFIGIDAGIFKEEYGVFELYIFEAKLFEDMCALFNLAMDSHAKLNRHRDPKRSIKTHEALCRATVSTALSFVEAYLNGIAVDYYVANKPTLDAETKAVLREWDDVRNRPRYLSLRDKALKYPRIVLGTAHPPLQENNCAELKYIVQTAKTIRDSIVHPSVYLKPEGSQISNYPEMGKVEFEEVERLVDSSIALVKKLELAITGDNQRLFWLHDRGPDGFFDDAVFA